jgi:hypothetical protein
VGPGASALQVAQLGPGDVPPVQLPPWAQPPSEREAVWTQCTTVATFLVVQESVSQHFPSYVDTPPGKIHTVYLLHMSSLTWRGPSDAHRKRMWLGGEGYSTCPAGAPIQACTPYGKGKPGQRAITCSGITRSCACGGGIGNGRAIAPTGPRVRSRYHITRICWCVIE